MSNYHRLLNLFASKPSERTYENYRLVSKWLDMEPVCKIDFYIDMILNGYAIELYNEIDIDEFYEIMSSIRLNDADINRSNNGTTFSMFV